MSKQARTSIAVLTTMLAWFGLAQPAQAARLPVTSTTALGKIQQEVPGLLTSLRYDTELNYGLAGPGPELPHRDMTAEQAQGWLSRTFIDAVRLGVAETHWFAWTTKYYGQYGIQLHPTTAANRQAWQTTHDWLVGSTFKACSDPDGAVICAFERDGEPFWLAYADDNALLDLPEGATKWCDLRGACVSTSGSKIVVGVRPIRIS